ncbi:hypothetical protein K788_0000530 [Paraburkholderia caribensis MBA4]|uniref:Uncharacterized protein n=1 Tax=Paraburkholderia caribensis MBA4 TaxID=1323664 RepID=A0A0P0RII4_9BURK|nr:SDR family NAD(P)-dependent oxidoreductase [Paraburkholderia caribensis]ALL68411.1 hypothetical protein K788_0000530 [Paraburkholderia caribensis MBA4]
MSNTLTVVIVTGASQGIGAALVEGFRQRDHKVVAISKNGISVDFNVGSRNRL